MNSQSSTKMRKHLYLFGAIEFVLRKINVWAVAIKISLATEFRDYGPPLATYYLLLISHTGPDECNRRMIHTICPCKVHKDILHCSLVSQPYFSLFLVPPTGNKEKYGWLARLIALSDRVLVHNLAAKCLSVRLVGCGLQKSNQKLAAQKSQGS